MGRADRRRALVVGGGIAGYAAALALSKAGMEVTIADDGCARRRTRAMSLWKNGHTALSELIGKETLSFLSPTSLVEVRSFAGDLLWSFPVGPWSEGNFWSVWHDDLLGALEKEAGDRGIKPLRLSLWRFNDGPSGVHAVFADGQECVAEIMVGADGLGSRVREQLLGAERPHDLGQEMTSGRVSVSKIARFRRPGQLLGPGRGFACQSESARFIATRLGDEISWMATTMVGDACAQAFASAMAPVQELMKATEESVGPFRLHDRPPAAAWVRGGVALLGESAHPMTPELGQGACLALEDAVVLGRCVKDLGPRPGLAAYERERRSRVDWITRLAHSMAVTALPGDRRLAALRDRLLPVAAPPLARAVFDRLVAWS